MKWCHLDMAHTESKQHQDNILTLTSQDLTLAGKLPAVGAAVEIRGTLEGCGLWWIICNKWKAPQPCTCEQRNKNSGMKVEGVCVGIRVERERHWESV